jgi:hypothetical protein
MAGMRRRRAWRQEPAPPGKKLLWAFFCLFYCETDGLTLDEVIDSNRMSQMNVFQKLGHPYIPFNYIRHDRPRGIVKYHDKIEWHVRHESTWWNTTVHLRARLVIPYLYHSFTEWTCLHEPWTCAATFWVARWFIFKTKNPTLGKLWNALDWKMLIYFMAICNILWTLGMFYDHLVHLVHFFPVLVSCTKKNLATLAPCGTTIDTMRPKLWSVLTVSHGVVWHRTTWK